MVRSNSTPIDISVPTHDIKSRPLSAIVLKSKERYSLHLRKRLRESHLSFAATVQERRKARCISSTPSQWELQLIEGLLGDDLDNSTDIEELPEIPEPSNQLQTQRLSIRKLPTRPTLKIQKVEPEVTEPLPKELEVQTLPSRPLLTVLQAVQANEEILDDCASFESEPESEGDFGDFEAPIDLQKVITFAEVPQIKLYADDWPLPKAEKPAPPSLYSVESHPHPLRGNPPDHQIRKCISNTSLRSVASNRSNRVGFVMQNNDSSLSLHSQGTLTHAATVLTHSSGYQHPSFTNLLSLGRSNATRSRDEARSHMKLSRPSLASRKRMARVSALLTPVTESFDSIAIWQGSLGNGNDSASEFRRPSTSSSLSAHKVRRFGHFRGAMVGTSRRNSGFLRP